MSRSHPPSFPGATIMPFRSKYVVMTLMSRSPMFNQGIASVVPVKCSKTRAALECQSQARDGSNSGVGRRGHDLAGAASDESFSGFVESVKRGHPFLSRTTVHRGTVYQTSFAMIRSLTPSLTIDINSHLPVYEGISHAQYFQTSQPKILKITCSRCADNDTRCTKTVILPPITAK